MNGMILAAGLGTRLLPLTRKRPKALVQVGGRALLERVLIRLARAGCDLVVINVHHHADMVTRYLSERATLGEAGWFRWHGTRVALSLEVEAPLDTGGGILHAAPLFRPSEPILVHNVDVISDVDLGRLAAAHRETEADATLAVSRRDTERRLVFDRDGLCGRIDTGKGTEEWARTPAAGAWQAGFAGIHVLSPGFPALIRETGAFSILTTYLRLASEGRRILPSDVTGCQWLDVGTPERLAQARSRIGGG